MARRSDHSRKDLTRMALDAAREIVVQDGIQALSGRKVTGRIGYTIGTLYQLFEDMDELVERLNAGTLAALHAFCSENLETRNVADQLKTLGLRFTQFVQAHPNEWDAVMTYRYKEDHVTSDFYAFEIQRLFGLMEQTTDHFYPDQQSKDEQAADMALLWSSLTGIWGVASSERQVGGTLEQMIERLVKLYIDARS